MTNFAKFILALFFIAAAVGAYFYINRTEVPAPVNEPPEVAESDIRGCYVATLGKDVYSLSISSQNGEEVEGTLVFKNFEKDSSQGAFRGTYRDGILLGTYSFNSEGTDSVMEVIFKRVGNDFVRGYGEVDSESGTRFTNLTDITYDFTRVFKASDTCATSLTP